MPDHLPDPRRRPGRLTARGVLDEGDLSVSGKDRAWFAELLGEELPSRPRRPLARPCLDWTERRSHLAGLAGRLLLGHLTREEWLVPVGSSRALRLTPRGGEALRELFGLDGLPGEARDVGFAPR